MKIARDGHPRPSVEFFPADFDGVLDQATDLELPSCRIEARDRAVVQHRPLQGERLTRRQASRFLYLVFALLALVPLEHGGLRLHRILPISTGGILLRFFILTTIDAICILMIIY